VKEIVTDICHDKITKKQTRKILNAKKTGEINDKKRLMQTRTLHIFFLRIAMALLLLMAFGHFSYAQGPGAAWTFYRPITLNPATPAANFQVKITLTAGQYTNMKADGSDLRIYDNTNTNCEYWLETWNTAGTSTIWVKVPTSGATALLMYYGNAAATAVSNGANVFDFFDDFTSPALTGWSTVATGGSVTQSGTNVTLSNTNGGTVSLSNTSAFTPSSTSFFLETKHREGAYNRNRFYATTTTSGGSPIALGDYGYFINATPPAQAVSKIFWNGTFLPATGTLLASNTDYLTRWQITDGSTYNWFTFNYSTGAALDATARNTTFASNIRFITFSVTEVAGTSTIVDWVRVRKFAATEPASSVGNQTSSAGVTSPANFPSSGVFVVPPNVTTVTVQAWGGGGGGGIDGANNNGAGGGGGGAYASSVVSVTPGQIINVTVGAGGTNGVAGGQSSFGSSVIALGGSSNIANSNGAAGGSGPLSTGTIKFSGGSGGNGGPAGGNAGGGGGSSASSSGDGVPGGNFSGSTGGTGGNGPDGDGGNGGTGSTTTGTGGTAGSIPGGGGGGRGDNGGNSASGANGQVIVTFTACATTFTSAAGTNAQTVCPNTAITNITYSVIGATNATVSGLPAGVTFNYNSGVVTISGTPTASGTFNYTVTPNAPCAGTTATGSITVRPLPVAAVTGPIEHKLFWRQRWNHNNTRKYGYRLLITIR
jgi:hypothetical protein